MGSMRNGEGDHWFCVFGEPGAFLKGFDHESPMSPWHNPDHQVWPGVLDAVPHAFSAYLKESAFSPEETSFCIWRNHADSRWHKGTIQYPDGPDPDGSSWMLSLLDGSPVTYKTWADGYYGKYIPLTAVEHIYAYRPLIADVVRELNPAIEPLDLRDDIAEIGYPTSL